MDNLSKAVQWRLEKTAAGKLPLTPEQMGAIKSGLMMGATVAVPTMGGVLGGMIHSKLAAPKKEELTAVQARYTTAKIQQALEELERKKKEQMMKETFHGRPSSLRI